MIGIPDPLSARSVADQRGRALGRIRHSCRRLKWREFYFTVLMPMFRLTLLMPLVFGSTAFVLMIWNGQISEVLQSLIETCDIAAIVAGLVILAAYSATLFVYYIYRTSARQVALYGSVSSQLLTPMLLKYRIVAAFLCAAFPWIGLVIAVSKLDLSNTMAKLFFILTLAAFALLFLVLFGFSSKTRNRRIFRRFTDLKVQHFWLYGAAALIFLPLTANPETLIRITRFLGPLAMISFELLFAFTILAAVAKAMRNHWGLLRRAFPWWLLFCGLVFLSKQAYQVIFPPNKRPVETANGTFNHLQWGFDTWFKARPGFAENQTARYPVFIVAAEGGGIYAATAVATFLARLKDECPACANHIFAISAVSGGSVGAAAYSAYDHDKTRTDPKGAKTSLQYALGQDHLSPVLGVLVPDLFWTLGYDLLQLAFYPVEEPILMAVDCIYPRGEISAAWQGFKDKHVVRRDRVLKRSFECASFAPDWPADCSDPRDAHPLMASIADQWAGGEGHAVFLNTTWVEKGTTVAFAPFNLASLNERRLLSFADPPFNRAPETVTLSEAAVASARFPLVLPPFAIPGPTGNMYFVDGGYADNSGVGVAGIIFDAIKRSSYAQQIDLRLIVITSDAGERKAAADEASGFDRFIDVVAPISALLSVRADLGPQEVARTINHFAPKDKPANSDDDPVIVIQYGSDFFLGWTISRQTQNVIECEIAGRPGCIGNRGKGLDDETLKHNADGIATIKRLVK